MRYSVRHNETLRRIRRACRRRALPLRIGFHKIRNRYCKSLPHPSLTSKGGHAFLRAVRICRCGYRWGGFSAHYRRLSYHFFWCTGTIPGAERRNDYPQRFVRDYPQALPAKNNLLRMLCESNNCIPDYTTGGGVRKGLFPGFPCQSNGKFPLTFRCFRDRIKWYVYILGRDTQGWTFSPPDAFIRI